MQESSAAKEPTSDEVMSEREFIASALLLLVLLVPFGIFLVGIGIYLYPGPSTSNLARRYLKAVITSHAEQAASLASPGCRKLVREDAREDIAKFGEATVRNVSVKIEPGTGSDNEIEFAHVSFQYRRGNETRWQPGSVGVMTDFRPGLRHITCGG